MLRIGLVLACTLVLAAPATAKQTPAQHAQHVISFFDHHRKAAASPAGQRVLWQAIHRLASTVRTLQAVRAAQAAFPPHHALWRCIAVSESGGNPRAGNGSHFGYLAMSYNWMKLIPTSAPVYGIASNMPQAAQEWVAEKAWSENGYSYDFLYQQWYRWDPADGCGTTG